VDVGTITMNTTKRLSFSRMVVAGIYFGGYLAKLRLKPTSDMRRVVCVS